MYRLSTKYLRPGMIVGQSIYNTNGLYLLARGTRLTPEYIGRLKELRLPSIYVTSSDLSLQIEPPPDVIQEKTRVHAIKNVFDLFKSCQLNKTIDVASLKSSVASIIHDLSIQQGSLAQISDLRLYDNYTFSHSVNVSVLATMVGKQLHYAKQTLSELTLGALLHDIGKIQVPLDILNKPGRLTPHEENLIQLHPEDGFKILYMSNQLTPQVMRIAFEHHEKFDGSGYPRQLAGKNILEYARIVAIADVYDALTSERPYKKAYTPRLAHNIMTKCNAGHFDPELLRLFFKNIAIYSVGSVLKLNVGYAIVKENSITDTLRPAVVHFADPQKRLLAAPQRIELRDNAQIEIERELDANDLDALLRTLPIDPAKFIVDDADSEENTM